jgi:hypothetical protein
MYNIIAWTLNDKIFKSLADNPLLASYIKNLIQ